MNHNGPTGNSADSDSANGMAHEYDRGRSGGGSRRKSSGTRVPPQNAPVNSDKPGFAIDAWSLLRPASRRWYWLVLGGALGAGLGAMLGFSMWRTGYSATAQIVRYDPPIATDAYRPERISGPTLVGMIQSPEVYKLLGQRMQPPVSGSQLSGMVKPLAERNSEIVNVEARGGNPKAAMDLANQYISAVVTFTQDHQRTEAEEADGYVTQQLKDTDADLATARKDMPTVSAGTLSQLETLAPAVVADRMAERLAAASEELASLLLTYTEVHPKVRMQQAKIDALKGQVNPVRVTGSQPAGAPRASAPAPLPGARGASAPRDEVELAYYNLRTNEVLRNNLIARQRAIQLFKANPPGNFRVMQPATMDNVAAHKPLPKIILLSAFFGTLGFVACGAELLRRELLDTRLKTEADVARVTGLPVLGSLGDVRRMSLSARDAWAFRTWIALQDRLAPTPNHGLICGVTSSNNGDGRSTWIGLLAGAARKCGFRVLTIATRATAEVPAPMDESAEPAAEQMADQMAEPVFEGAIPMPQSATRQSARHATHEPAARGNAGTSTILTNPNDLADSSGAFTGESEFTSLAANALFTPSMVTEKLMGPETDPLVHIPLPGWTWNLERRKQCQTALNVWRKIDNVVILVELPPASMPESVLLASNLPNLLWLAEAGKSQATDTRDQLQTLRHARCNLVGAVVNRALAPVAHGRLARWVGCLTMFAALGLAGNTLIAAEANPAAPGTSTFSISSPAHRAAWQQKLTLGAGDILTLSLYGEPLLTREEVPVGPDGRISYLEAQNVMAAGLTVDEFRERLNEDLGKYRRAPQAYVVPFAYKSKKYFMLGKVAQRGAFTLDRPITLIEAVARARGMETGLAADRSLVELADLSRSFISRGGRKLPVDFEKLFQEGDLTQNVALEPNDYVYFPASDQKEVYVLGSVRFPGAYSYQTTTGALGAIAARGGFTERAWKNKLLVVRGSLGKPETFVINAVDVLSAQQADLKLKPRDIIYVSDRPWARAEELLDALASAFVTSAVVTWTGIHVDGASR